MGEHEVAHDGLRHFLRGLNGCLTLARGESLDFENVSALTLHAGRHLIESVFGILAQDRLAGTEADFSLVRGLVLIDIADYGLNILHASGDLLRGLLRGGGFVAGVDGVLVGFIGLVRGELDARLRARVNVFDLLAVARGQFVEFVDAVTDRFGLTLKRA